MIKIPLDNMFRKQEPLKRYVSVVKKLAPGRYQTEDIQGRFFNADSDIEWRAGDTVVIQSGNIIGRTGKLEQPKVYEV